MRPTGYNLTNLVGELLIKLYFERKNSAQPSFFLGNCLYEWHHTVGKQNLIHPIAF